MSKNRKKLVQGCNKALEAMKYEYATEIGIIGSSKHDFNNEFAEELGVQSTSSYSNIDWGSLSSRQNGYIGGSITKRLVQQAMQSTHNLN